MFYFSRLFHCEHCTQRNHKWHPSFWTLGCPSFWWTWLCLWDFLCTLRLHWRDAQIHLLRKCSNFSCTWGLAAAACNWVIGLFIHPWLTWPDVILFLSCWVFVLSVWDVCCCGAVARLLHSLVVLSCCSWLAWRVLIGTFTCWIFCSVCFRWPLWSFSYPKLMTLDILIFTLWHLSNDQNTFASALNKSLRKSSMNINSRKK